MAEVGIRALKQNASAVIARVEAGETITVTDRGRPAALLTPIPSSPLAQLIASGRARPARRSLQEFINDEPPVEPRPGPTLSERLREMRDDERY
jgi:prevent-host-death family protein